MQTPREYLVSLGLAKPGKGRFSKEAVAALAAARAKGIQFKEAEVKPTTPRRPRVAVKTETPKPEVKVDPKAVRAWAVEAGHTVGQRGRIHNDLVVAYLADRESTGQAVEVARDEYDLYRPSAARIRYHDFYTATDLDGKTHRRTFRDCCVNCGYSIGWCYCPEPLMFSLVKTSETLVLSGIAGVDKRVTPW